MPATTGRSPRRPHSHGSRPAGPYPLPLRRGHRGRGRGSGRGLHRARSRGGAQAAGDRVRGSDQDDDRAGDLLHARTGHRRRPPGGQGGPHRRTGARLLPDDVHHRPGHRPDRREPHPPGCEPRPRPRAVPPAPRPPRPPRQHGTTEFLLGIIPTSLASAFTEGVVLQTLLVALLTGFALQAMGRQGEPILRGVGLLQKLVFRILAMIMWAAPIGCLRRHGRRRRRDRHGRPMSRAGPDHARLLRHLRCVRRRRARAAAAPGRRASTSSRCCAISAASSCSSSPRRRLSPRSPGSSPRWSTLGVSARRRDHRPDRVLIQPRRHGHLPDDGVTVHRRRAGRPALHRPSRSGCWSS